MPLPGLRQEMERKFKQYPCPACGHTQFLSTWDTAPVDLEGSCKCDRCKQSSKRKDWITKPKGVS